MPFYDALKFIATTVRTAIKRKRWEEGFYVTKEYDEATGRTFLMMHFILDGAPCRETFKISAEDLLSEDWVTLPCTD